MHRDVIRRVTDGIAAGGISPLALTFSPIKGADGNIEYLLYSKKEGAVRNEISDDMIEDIVTRKTGIGVENIVITPMSSAADTAAEESAQ